MISQQLINVLKLFAEPKYYAHTSTAIEINQLIDRLSLNICYLSQQEKYQITCILAACAEAIESSLFRNCNRDLNPPDSSHHKLHSLLAEIEQTTRLLILNSENFH